MVGRWDDYWGVCFECCTDEEGVEIGFGSLCGAEEKATIWNGVKGCWMLWVDESWDFGSDDAATNEVYEKRADTI